MSTGANLEVKNRVVYDSAKEISHAVAELKEIWNYRFLLQQLVKRDLTTRYKRSFLGVAWTMLNPLGTSLILSVVFSQLFKAEHTFPVYILSGIIAWTFFSQVTTAAIGGLVWGGSLLKQIFVPRTIFGVSALGTGIVNYFLSLVPLVVVMIFTRTPLSWPMLFIPVALLILAAFTLGVGLLISSLAIYFPDVAEMYSIVLMAWMYFTPIIYMESQLSAEFVRVIAWNPMFWIMRLFRLPIYYMTWPTWSDIWPALAWAAGTLIVGWVFFTSRSDEYSYRV